MTVATVRRTGRKIPFLDIGIGSPYWAHDRLWVRTDFEAGTELHGTDGRHSSTCDFLIDGTVKSARCAPGRVCEEVEIVEVVVEPSAAR